MANQISAVLQNTLRLGPDGEDTAIRVGDPAWFDWLATARSFRYECPDGYFTARSEQASHGRGGWYWKAYRRSGGRLRRAYLGPSNHLTAERLTRAAAALAEPPAGRSHRAPPSAGPAKITTRRSGPVAESIIRAPARLQLLGAFGVIGRDGNAVRIASTRAQSVVAYLALHRDTPQSRGHMAFLAWPDSTEAQARNNLRQLLHQLRLSWPDAEDLLSVHATTLSLRSDLVVDVDEYEAALAAAFASDGDSDPADVRAAHERAAGLYRGDLIPGSWDEWAAAERERLRIRHQRLLDRLVGLLEQQGDYRAAIEYGQQRLRLDPLDERVYRWLMRLHALNQDRAGALRVYQECAALLESELGVEPDPATRQAYEHIVRLDGGASYELSPASGIEDAPPTTVPSSAVVPLVGRRREWAQMMTAWHHMTEGQAHLLLIRGEAGIGKSRLAAELRSYAAQQQVQSAGSRAWGAEGWLSYGPIADWLRSPPLAPVLPRLDLASLSEISRLLPELLAQRPDLPRPSARIEDWQRQPFFQALATAFLTADGPLLLVLDDLQWCDADTLQWLHFLLRLGRDARLLVTGTVRSDEVDPTHPVFRLVAEMRDAGQLTEINLGPLGASETAELAAGVAGRPLAPAATRLIHTETEGNPLFVVETVRAGLIDGGAPGTGALASTAASKKVTPVEPRGMPPKVQAIIAARLARLSDPARDVASLAATVGRAFTLEVVRDGSGLGEEILVVGLDELLRRQIVRELGNGAYDFTHDKIREVAYAEMTEARRRLLNRRVAETLERVHAAALDGVAAQIAAHYANAGVADRAIVYYQRAAEVAQRVGANLEAIGLLQRGITLLERLSPSSERDTRELAFQTALGVSLVATEGYGAPQVRSVYARARQLCQLLGQSPSAPILRALALASLAQAGIEECHALGDHLMSLAESSDDLVLRVEAHFVIAASLLLTGAAVPARVQLEASLAHYDRSRSAAHVSLYSQDPAVVCLIRLSVVLWLLGEPDASERRRSESLRLAEELAHPFTHAYALTWDAILQSHRGDPGLARTRAEAAISLGREHKMPFWLSIGRIVRGWAVAEQGDRQVGIDEIQKGMADFAATGSGFMRPFQLGLLAEQYGRLGKVERGLALIDEGLAVVEATNERWSEPELHRRRGELFEMTSDDGRAEVAYRRAIDVARYQGVRALELRSATRLAGIWLRQRRNRDAATLLRPIVDVFGSANGLPDLEGARALLGRATQASRSTA